MVKFLFTYELTDACKKKEDKIEEEITSKQKLTTCLSNVSTKDKQHF